MLSSPEIAAYQTNGYVTPDWTLPAELLAGLRDQVDRLIAANPHLRPEQIVCPHLEGGAGDDVHGGLHAFFLNLAHHPAIVGAVAAAAGPGLILWGAQLFSKRAEDGLGIPWHQDGHYWPIRPLATCSVWIAVDEATAENGCLRVIPGSHGGGLLDHETTDGKGDALNSGVALSARDQAAARDIVLAPGQISLHDIFLLHGSEPNRSPKRRAGLVFRYMPATSRYDRGVPDRVQPDGHRVHYATRPLWQVHGDNPGENRVEPKYRYRPTVS